MAPKLDFPSLFHRLAVAQRLIPSVINKAADLFATFASRDFLLTGIKELASPGALSTRPATRVRTTAQSDSGSNLLGDSTDRGGVIATVSDEMAGCRIPGQMVGLNIFLKVPILVI